MRIPKVSQEELGKIYLVGFCWAILALMFGGVLAPLASVFFLVWAFYSDDDTGNHTDPPGTQYMDRDGKPVGGAEKEDVK